MREIKFRGKCVDTGVWIYGGYFYHENRMVSPIGDSLKQEDAQHLICRSGFADWNMPRRMEAVDVIPETVGQFTGLKDVNGKEIYEGDMLQVINNPLVNEKPYYVCWSQELAGWQWVDKDSEDDWNAHIAKASLIIGNIHDNPELLEV